MKTIRIIAVVCLMGLLCEPTYAQSLKDLFLKMPQEVCPLLSEYNRLELVDNQKNGKPMQTRNLLSTITKMETLTDEYAHLIATPSSEKTFKLLPLSDGNHLILVVSTVRCDSLTDSSISFYATDWQPLPATSYIPSLTNFPSDDFCQISIAPTSNQLTITTSQPLALRIDGGNPPVTTTTTQQWVWNAEENKFVVSL